MYGQIGVVFLGVWDAVQSDHGENPASLPCKVRDDLHGVRQEEGEKHSP